MIRISSKKMINDLGCAELRLMITIWRIDVVNVVNDGNALCRRYTEFAL